ncbi:MAG: rRNA maturation RNase YbeY [Rikenellaceae bacterium]|nr:rRNA maturation RNase YbeY [Rikenellaceae bacterium]
MISFQAQDIDFKLRGRRVAAAWLRAVAGEEGRRVGELSVVFTSAAYLLEVNRKYLKHDYHTDIITFDYVDPLRPDVVSGDLLIDIETVAENAAGLGITFDEELRRVMVHGVLHLCGHGDKSATERAAMRAWEDFYLKRFALMAEKPDKQ